MQNRQSPSPSSERVQRRTSPRLHFAAVSHETVPDIERQHRKTTADYSKPVLQKTIVIHTNPVQQAFEHVYVRADYSLYAATAIARDQHRIADARKAEAALHALFEKFSSSLSDTVAELGKLIETQVSEENRKLIYDHTRTFTVPARTGYSMRFLNLTQMLDTLVAWTDTLNINNVMTPENCDRSIKSWIRLYRSFCRNINKIRTESLQTGSQSQEHS